MILTCPQCETRYEADASNFAPPGRKVRCAKCGHLWHQVAPTSEPEPRPETIEPPASAAPDAVGESEPQLAADEPAAEATAIAAPPPATKKPRTQTPQHIGMIAGWLGLVILILVIGWCALAYRQQIATAWPQAGSLYSALGMSVNTRGLDFVDVALHRQSEDGRPVWAVTGKLVNVSGQDQTVPPIEVMLTDKNKRVLYHWRFNSGVAVLKPGQTAAFLTRLSSPPTGARHLELRFAATGG
ncbi:MAG TPA: DUF3426 domain-containing protein [Rhizomicrobium sp.]|jgi:predicted Zn finger-like uncharacterized protein